MPKLLFGNNFEELEEADFDAVLFKLQEILAKMGVLVEVETLKNAKVCCVHFGKNVILAEAPSSLIINTIRKLNISKRLDAGNTDYRNDGQAIRYHANSYELTFYDKVKDLEQSKISEKRAIECDNEFNFDFFSAAGLASIFDAMQKIRKTCPITYRQLTFSLMFLFASGIIDFRSPYIYKL